MSTTTPPNPAAVTPVLSAKERARNAARKEAATRTGGLAEFLEAMADELDRQIAYDATRSAGNVGSVAPAAVTTMPASSAKSTSGTDVDHGGEVKGK